MNELDPVFARLRELPIEAPSAALSKQITALAHARLVPTRVHPLWSLAIAASVLAYLSWALIYTGQL